MLAVLMRVAFFLLHHQEHWAFDNDMSALNNDSDSCNLLLIINPPTRKGYDTCVCVWGGGGDACINSQQ